MIGGGFISTAIKHSRINDAKQQAHAAQQSLRRFQREIRDVNDKIETNIDIEIGSFSTFADYFFDGLIMDWIVQSRIHESRNKLENSKFSVRKAMSHLERLKTETKEKLEGMKQEKKNLIEKA